MLNILLKSFSLRLSFPILGKIPIKKKEKGKGKKGT